MAVIRSDFYHCWLVRQPVSSLPSHDITIVIYAMVVSKLDYWNLPYKGLPLNLIWKLQLVQNAAAYLLTGTFPKASIQPVLCQVHQLPVEYQIKVKIMMLTFKALLFAPTYRKDCLSHYVPQRALHSSDQHFLVIPSLKDICLASVRTRTFSALAPTSGALFQMRSGSCRTYYSSTGPEKWGCSRPLMVDSDHLPAF